MLVRPFSRLSTGLWFIPLMCVLAGVGLSFGTIAIDKANDYDLIPESISGGPDAALEILGTVAASMVSLAALVLTITMVVVQLAMGQFSPRIVQRILQDKPSQLAIGVFETWPMACECSLISPSDPYPTPLFLIRRPQCKRQIGYMIAYVSLHPDPFRMVDIATTRVACV